MFPQVFPMSRINENGGKGITQLFTGKKCQSFPSNQQAHAMFGFTLQLWTTKQLRS